jgi:hypothetical protein
MVLLGGCASMKGKAKQTNKLAETLYNHPLFKHEN